MIFFFFISSSLLFSSLLFSSLLFSSLLFSSLLFSSLLFSPLLFSSLLFSSLPLLFSSLFFASLFSLCLLSLSSFSVSVSVCCVVWCGVCCVVWHAENPVCRLKTLSVCRFKTSPCMPQHAHMLFSMWAWCRYTQGRFESTHGKRFESTHGGHRQFCLPRKAHAELVLGPTSSPKVTTGCCPCSSLRKDREQHVPDSSNHSLYLIKLLSSSYPRETLEGTSREMVRFVFRSHEKKYNRTICALVSLEASTRVSPDFALLTVRSPSFQTHSTYTNTYTCTYTYKYTCTCAQTHTQKHTHTHAHVHAHAHAHAQTQRQTQTQRHRHRETDTETHETHETHETQRHTRHRDTRDTVLDDDSLTKCFTWAMNAVTKLNTRPQDAQSTQGKVGHHNVTRSGVRKSQETCAVQVSVTTCQHPDIQTHRHTDTWTHGHTDTETQRHRHRERDRLESKRPRVNEDKRNSRLRKCSHATSEVWEKRHSEDLGRQEHGRGHRLCISTSIRL